MRLLRRSAPSTVKGGAALDDTRRAASRSIASTTWVPRIHDRQRSLVVNEGTIEFSNIDGRDQDLANAGVTSGITIATGGKITIGETYAPTDK